VAITANRTGSGLTAVAASQPHCIVDGTFSARQVRQDPIGLAGLGRAVGRRNQSVASADIVLPDHKQPCATLGVNNGVSGGTSQLVEKL